MTTSAASVAAATPADQPQGFVVRIVGAAAFAHLLNDLIQAVLPSIYPMLKSDFALSFAQIGWIALVYQVTASLLQPWVGMFTDKHPQPYLLPAGMVVTLVGIALLALPAAMKCCWWPPPWSAWVRPPFARASRVARMASGGRFGTAQSTFQVGGNTGSALGPLLTAAIIIPHGQPAIAWFMLAAALAVLVLLRVTGWSVRHGQARLKSFAGQQAPGLSRGAMWRAVVVIAVLMFAKFVYIASFTNFFTFYLIEHFGLSVQHSQLYLFVFLAAVALGTLPVARWVIASGARP